MDFCSGSQVMVFLSQLALAVKCQCQALGDSLGELSQWLARHRAAPDPSRPAFSRHTWGQAEQRAPRGPRGAGDSPAAARPAGSTSTSGRGPSRPPPGTPPPPPWRACDGGPGRHRDGGPGCAVAEDRATEGRRTGPGGDGGPSGGDREGRPGRPQPRRGQRTGPSRGWRTGRGWGPGAGGTLQRTRSRARRRCATGRPGAASPLPVRSDRNFWRAVGWRAEGKEEVGAARAATATHGRGGQLHAASRGVRPFAQSGGMRGRSVL